MDLKVNGRVEIDSKDMKIECNVLCNENWELFCRLDVSTDGGRSVEFLFCLERRREGLQSRSNRISTLLYHVEPAGINCECVTKTDVLKWYGGLD